MIMIMMIMIMIIFIESAIVDIWKVRITGFRSGLIAPMFSYFLGTKKSSYKVFRGSGK